MSRLLFTSVRLKEEQIQLVIICGWRAEEGSPFMPPHGKQRISFVPKPSGLRFYHTHVAPSLSRGGDMDMDALAGAPIKALQRMGKAADDAAAVKAKGFEVGYELFSINGRMLGHGDINGRMLGHGDPIRVKAGERVLFHVVNASAGEIRVLALPGHVFHVVAPDETIEMAIVKHNAALNGLNQWTINGEAFSMETMKPGFTLKEGRRYWLKFRNASDDFHPLHRYSFELTRIGGKATAGVMKDVVMLGGFQESEVDFVADHPGPPLFHCHQQLHVDFGLMALFNYG